jgi:hypothetical protein
MLKNIPFYLIFPLFILYNIGLLHEFFPLIPGGYYFLMLPISAVLILIVTFSQSNFKFVKTDFIFLVYIILSSLIYLINLPNAEVAKIIYYSQIILIQVLIYFSIRQFNFSTKSIKFIKILYWTIIVGLILKLTDSFYLYFDSAKGMSSYQGLSRNFIVISVILIYLSKNKVQLLYFLPTVFILFILGSRSEFALFLIGLFAVFIFNKKATMKKLLGIFMSIIFLILVYNPQSIKNLNEVSRIFSIINFQSVYANEGRGLLTDKSIETINENIFFGDFNNVDIGSSAHNILSAWEINGLLFFLIVLGISIANFFMRLKDFRNLTSNFYAKVAFFYSIIWFVGMFTSYWYGNEMFAIALGFSAKLDINKSYLRE